MWGDYFIVLWGILLLREYWSSYTYLKGRFLLAEILSVDDVSLFTHCDSSAEGTDEEAFELDCVAETTDKCIRKSFLINYYNSTQKIFQDSYNLTNICCSFYRRFSSRSLLNQVFGKIEYCRYSISFKPNTSKLFSIKTVFFKMFWTNFGKFCRSKILPPKLLHPHFLPCFIFRKTRMRNKSTKIIHDTSENAWISI